MTQLYDSMPFKNLNRCKQRHKNVAGLVILHCTTKYTEYTQTMYWYYLKLWWFFIESISNS